MPSCPGQESTLEINVVTGDAARTLLHPRPDPRVMLRDEVKGPEGFVCSLDLCRGFSSAVSLVVSGIAWSGGPSGHACGVIPLIRVRRSVHCGWDCSLGKDPGQYRSERAGQAQTSYPLRDYGPIPSSSLCLCDLLTRVTETRNPEPKQSLSSLL